MQSWVLSSLLAASSRAADLAAITRKGSLPRVTGQVEPKRGRRIWRRKGSRRIIKRGRRIRRRREEEDEKADVVEEYILEHRICDRPCP